MFTGDLRGGSTPIFPNDEASRLQNSFTFRGPSLPLGMALLLRFFIFLIRIVE